ncbi:sensor histidine kinase [Nakamurella lactea]|uniref:sensor histidine kinase n=1 Tax=Nakamurella lactea TaxID=459515 RepID=UPI00048B91A6|nr:histidine kinase [Nakamurella lactea]
MSGITSDAAVGDPHPGRERLARVLAWPALLMPALILALHLANANTPVQTWWFGFFVIGGGLGAMGALLATKVPDNPIGWIFLVGGIGEGLTGFGREWAVFGYVTHPGSLPFPEWAAWFGWGATISLATLPLALLRFPDGRLSSRRWLIVQWAVVCFTAVSVVAQMLTATEYTEEMPGLRNPIGVPWSGWDAIELVAWTCLSATVVLAALSLVLRWRGATPQLRRPLRWVTIAGVALCIETVLENTPMSDRLAIFDWLGPLVFLIFVGTVTLAILRYRLWDIDVLIDLSLVYGILTVLVGGLFVAAVTLAGKVLDQQDALWPALVAIGVFALAFVPLRNRIQQLVDRVRTGARTDPYRMLSILGRDPDQPAGSALLAEALEVAVGESGWLDYLCVTPTDSPPVTSGAARTEKHGVTLMFSGVPVGEMQVAFRPGTTGRVGPAQLAELANRVAAVAHAVGVGEAVAQSRRNIAVAREEERRRVRRDLHDGLGPALAAIAMRVDGARMLVGSDPLRATEVLSKLGDDVRTTIDDVRRLVYDLQPPVLDAVGLVAALAEQASAFSGSAAVTGLADGTDQQPGLSVELVAPTDFPDLPAAVEIACYRIVCEALANVARHSLACHCQVTLTLADDVLQIVVDDDGQGVATGARPGVGTASMIERATELGGGCLLSDSPMGGTRVTATLPVGPTGPPARSVVASGPASGPAPIAELGNTPVAATDPAIGSGPALVEVTP